MKKLFTIIFLLLFIPLVAAVDFIPQGDINLKGVYSVKNATNVTALHFYYPNGTELVSGSGSGGTSNWSAVTNKPFDTVNSTQFNTSGSVLTILTSWLQSLFYTESEIDTALGLKANQSSLATEISLQSNNNATQATLISGLQSDNSTQASLISTEVALQLANNNSQASLISSLTTLQSNNNVTQAALIVGLNNTMKANNITLASWIVLLNNTLKADNITQASLISGLQNDNTTQATLISARAFPGTCAAGTVVQNTTTSGVQCVAAGAGGLSSITVYNSTGGSQSANATNFTGTGVTSSYVDANGVHQAVFTGGTGGGGDPSNAAGWSNATTTLVTTPYNVSIQGRLIVTGSNGGIDVNTTTLDMSNNFCQRWSNSTGTPECGVWLDTNNCWHFGWSVVDCRN